MLGLFTGGNMTTEWKGPVAALGDGVPAHTCVTTNRPANEPSPADMTRKALELPAEHAAHRLGRPRVGVRARRGKVLGTTDHTNSFSLLQGG